jgi:hypothetical protein
LHLPGLTTINRVPDGAIVHGPPYLRVYKGKVLWIIARRKGVRHPGQATVGTAQNGIPGNDPNMLAIYTGDGIQ